MRLLLVCMLMGALSTTACKDRLSSPWWCVADKWHGPPPDGSKADPINLHSGPCYEGETDCFARVKPGESCVWPDRVVCARDGTDATVTCYDAMKSCESAAKKSGQTCATRYNGEMR